MALLTLLTAAAVPLLGRLSVGRHTEPDGCPAGYQTLPVAGLSTQGGYRLPGQLANAGNNDGLVRGKPFHGPAATGICGVLVLYDCLDNPLTPTHGTDPSGITRRSDSEVTT